MERIENLPAPQVPAPETLADARFTFQAGQGRQLLTYCPLRNVGGVFDRDTGIWTLWAPITFEKFAQILAGTQISVTQEQQDEAELWARTCSAAERRPGSPIWKN